MPIPDTTILDMILAGDLAEASDAIEAGWPQAIFDVIQASAYRATAAGSATSGSSVTIGTGPRTFTLAEPRGWRSGTPIYIMEAADPQDRYMVGKLSADETAGGVVTVEVSAIAGTGTYTSWTLLALFASQTIPTPPGPISEGFTGASDEPGVRANFELIRRRSVLAVTPTPASSPSTGDRYAIGVAPTGAWVGQSGWATWDGAAWVFEAPDLGDLSLPSFAGTAKTWVWGGTAWRLLASEAPGPPRPRAISAGATLDPVTLRDDASTFYLTAGGTPFTITLPIASAAPNAQIVLINLSGASVTFNVTSGGTINGSPSLVVAAGASARLFAYSNDDTEDHRWLAW